MDAKELADAIKALEPTIDRLRALYEQYFMGLEKIEPQVLRKKVDRELQRIRKVRIQNTGQRYKFQMLVQRYNTYQQYWGRIIREMDRGTYRRDVMRAAKRVGEAEALTIVGRRRAKMFQKLAEKQEGKDGAEAAEGAADGAAPDGGDYERYDSDAPTPPRGMVSPGVFSVEEPTGGWDAPSELQAALTAATVPAEAAAQPPPGAYQQPAAQPTYDPAAQQPGYPPAQPHQVPAVAPTPVAPTEDDAITNRPPPPAPRGNAPPQPSRPLPPPRHAPTAPATPPAAQPTPPAAASGRPSIEPPTRRRPPARPPAASRRASSAREGVSEQRAGELYRELVQAKRQANESTAGLTYDKLRKSLESQSAKLRKRHGNSKIDYEVVTKNGRTLIRPVVSK